MFRFQPVGNPPILPSHQDASDAHAPLIQRTTTAIFPTEGETSNVEQETRPRPIKPRYTAEQIHIMIKNDLGKHTRAQIGKDTLWAVGNQVALLIRSIGTAALTAATIPLILEKFLPKDSDAYQYSRLVLTHYAMNGAIAGINEGGRQLFKATTGALTQKTLTKQYVKRSFKENDKMIKNFFDYLSGGWQQEYPQKAAMMAQKMRDDAKKSGYHEQQTGLAIVDDAIDEYLDNGKPKDVGAFHNFLHHLKAWELMARAPLPHEFSNLSHWEKNGDPAKQAKFDAAQAEVEAMVPATIKNELSSFMSAWRLSTLPGTSPSKDFIALVGERELPDGTSDVKYLAEEICKKLTQKEPVSLTADVLNEFIDVVVSKDAVPRVKQKTADPELALGPFLKWIESGNSACPIVITDVDFKNPKHVRLIENLRKSTEIDIYYDEIKGVKFTVNTQRTRFILCADKPSHKSEMPHLVAQAVIGPPSEEDRRKVLELTLKKQRSNLLDNLSYTDEQKDAIEELILQKEHADLIIEKSMKHHLSYKLMREMIIKILVEVSSGYKRIGALQGVLGTPQERPESSEGETRPSPFSIVKNEFDDSLQKFIKDRFKAFPKQAENHDKKDAKGKKDVKGKNVTEEQPPEKYVQAPTNELDSASLSGAHDILYARRLASLSAASPPDDYWAQAGD